MSRRECMRLSLMPTQGGPTEGAGPDSRTQLAASAGASRAVALQAVADMDLEAFCPRPGEG